MKFSKKQLTNQWLVQHPVEDWGACIHCGKTLKKDGESFICEHHHRFDGAKQGYYHLAKTNLSDTKYDAELFAARRRIILETGLYDALHQRLSHWLATFNVKNPVLLDAGSGEGSHLKRISDAFPSPKTLIGLDLAKAGIQLATDYNGEIFSIIADLAKLPIQDETVDGIFSILSPANYHEFNRVLKPNGFVIKVVPNANYLIEIRHALLKYRLSEKGEYDNSKVVEVFFQHYPDAKIEVVQVKTPITLEDKEALVKMTPLAWRLTDLQRRQLVRDLPDQITFDCSVLIAHKR